jgi:phosphinothricin acetyltransferase
MNHELKIRIAEIKDVPGITDIYNDAILNTTATCDTEIKSIENRMEWLNAHSKKYPVIVAVKNDEVLGWASMSRWSDRIAYTDTAEISVYIHKKFRDKGIGKLLLKEIIEAGKIGGLHCVLSRITQGNEKSIYLHEKFGFTNVGVMKEVANKFGKILDVHMMQLLYK